MNAEERKKLSKEAEMQIVAIKKINRWKIIAIAISTLGVAITYAGLCGNGKSPFLGISGIVITVLSVIIALILNLGVKNGKRNVEKILNVLEMR